MGDVAAVVIEDRWLICLMGPRPFDSARGCMLHREWPGLGWAAHGRTLKGFKFAWVQGDTNCYAVFFIRASDAIHVWLGISLATSGLT